MLGKARFFVLNDYTSFRVPQVNLATALARLFVKDEPVWRVVKGVILSAGALELGPVGREVNFGQELKKRFQSLVWGKDLFRVAHHRHVVLNGADLHFEFRLEAFDWRIDRRHEGDARERVASMSRTKIRFF
jgi:hypothetical protein